MRVVHFSDWHGSFERLPKADLYVCTGDMLPNFPVLIFDSMSSKKNLRSGNGEVRWQANLDLLGLDSGQRPQGVLRDRHLIRKEERRLQDMWIDRLLTFGGYRSMMESPDAPVALVPGNHCFVQYARAFGGEVWEVDEDSSRTWDILGLKIGGIRGINYISGEWNDELDDLQWKVRMDSVPKDIDVLISHAPPRGILDLAGQHFGSDALRSYVSSRSYSYEENPCRKILKAHFFGHIHEDHGGEMIDGTLYANAATTQYSYDL